MTNHSLPPQKDNRDHFPPAAAIFEIFGLIHRALMGNDGWNLLRGVGSFPKTRALTPSARRTQVAWALHSACADLPQRFVRSTTTHASRAYLPTFLMVLSPLFVQ